MSICAIIDPNQWLVSQQQSITQYPIHALDGMEFAMAVEYAASKTVDKNNDVNSIRLRRLKEIVRDTSDLFFQIQGDGSMAIWGVQVGFLEGALLSTAQGWDDFMRTVYSPSFYHFHVGIESWQGSSATTSSSLGVAHLTVCHTSGNTVLHAEYHCLPRYCIGEVAR